MDAISEHADERHKNICIHCGKGLGAAANSRDHVPSRCLLIEPLPENIPVVRICAACNSSFSMDEEYFVAFIGSVLVGSTEPALQRIASAARILERNGSLRTRIDQARTEVVAHDGNTQVTWKPEIERAHRIIVKNARGHALYENGEGMLSDPSMTWSAPLVTLSARHREEFENVDNSCAWPEVGSRMMMRVLTSQDLDDGWIVVQDGVYRYCVVQDHGLVVRSVLYEYLATEVRWPD